MSFKSQRLQGNARLNLVASNSPEMKIKEKGQAVRMVQQGLIELGHPLPKTTKKYGTPDGIYGKETKAAVWKFQEKNNLYKDGVVGTNTITKMDGLLVGKPYTPLPTIPDMDIEDDGTLADTEDLILSTLGSGYMNSMGFSLAFDQRSGEHHEVHIYGPSYQIIGQAIYDGDIGLVIDPSIGPAAFYDIHTDTLKIRRALKPNVNDRAIIIHEATHAICDWKGNPMNALFSEMVAFVAEGIYVLKTTGGKKVIGNEYADLVYKRAHDIAELLRTRQPIPADDLSDLGTAIESTPDYGQYTHGTTPYNGRSNS